MAQIFTLRKLTADVGVEMSTNSGLHHVVDDFPPNITTGSVTMYEAGCKRRFTQ